MATSYTSLLGLALPVTGELNGTWGDTVNNSITSLLDTAVAGTTTLSTDADVTLTTTTGASNQARQAILLFSGARTALRTITAPAASKIYTVINATTGGFAVKLVGVGPTTGLTIPAGASAVVAWNGSDFIEVGTGTIGNLTVNGTLTVTSTASATKFIPTGGAATGNGMYLPTTNALGFSTDGSERMRLDAAGNLGLGVTPSASSLAGFLEGGYGTFGQTTSLGTSIAGNAFYNSGWKYKLSSSATLQLQDSGGFKWYIAASGTAGNAISFTQAMTLDASGNLGIGATSPADTNNFGRSLDIRSSTGAAAYFRDSDDATKYSVAGFFGADSNAYYGAWGTGTGVLFYSASTERMRLDSAGNLGLGVTPSAWDNRKAFQNGAAAFASADGNRSVAEFSANSYLSAGGTFRYLYSSANATLYQQATGAHSWFTAASGTAGNAITFTQAMTLDASGNLGVGVTSPSTRLDVSQANAKSATGVWQAQIFDSTSQTTGVGGGISFSGYKTTQSSAEVFAAIDGYKENSTAGNAAGALRFHTQVSGGSGLVERARITSGGYFKASVAGTYNADSYHELRTNNNARTVYVTNTHSSSPFGILMGYTGAAPNGTGNAFFECEDTGGARAVIRSNGGIANYSANDVNLSDRREKTNFAPAGEYLSKICAIPVQTFNYIDQNLEEDDGLTLGVVAQDVQAVAPELVMESNWGTAEAPKQRLSIYQTDLQYALMKCIQEQQALIQSLNARIAALETK